MSTSVTMSLEEFRELEGKAKAFENLIGNKDVIVMRVPYGSTWIYHQSQKEVFEEINKEILHVSELAETWRQAAKKASK